MALILDESFLTGIPANFATVRAQSGTMTIAYNAAAQAVDMGSSAAGQSLWDITSLPLMSAGEVEMDIELLSIASDVSNYRGGGVWLVSGAVPASNGIRLGHDRSIGGYYSQVWVSASLWGGSEATVPSNVFLKGSSFPFDVVGDRRIFNIRWNLGSVAGKERLSFEFRLDGNLILCRAAPLGMTSLRPAPHLYQSSIRVHSIRVWDAPQAELASIGARGSTADAALRVCAPPEALEGIFTVDRGMVLGKQDVYQGGGGRVAGTVKEKNVPVNTPTSRRVQLINESTRLLVRELWSDPITGGYSFDYVSMHAVYTVLSYDYTGAFRAVVADRIVPELIT